MLWMSCIGGRALVPDAYKSKTQVYKTFFMLNSTEHEISTAHKN